jgi:hypothetical protein
MRGKAIAVPSADRQDRTPAAAPQATPGRAGPEPVRPVPVRAGQKHQSRRPWNSRSEDRAVRHRRARQLPRPSHPARRCTPIAGRGGHVAAGRAARTPTERSWAPPPRLWQKRASTGCPSKRSPSARGWARPPSTGAGHRAGRWRSTRSSPSSECSRACRTRAPSPATCGPRSVRGLGRLPVPAREPCLSA